MNSNDLFKYIEEEHKKRNLKIRNVSLLLHDIPEWHLYKNENGENILHVLMSINYMFVEKILHNKQTKLIWNETDKNGNTLLDNFLLHLKDYPTSTLVKQQWIDDLIKSSVSFNNIHILNLFNKEHEVILKNNEKTSLAQYLTTKLSTRFLIGNNIEDFKTICKEDLVKINNSDVFSNLKNLNKYFQFYTVSKNDFHKLDSEIKGYITLFMALQNDRRYLEFIEHTDIKIPEIINKLDKIKKFGDISFIVSTVEKKEISKIKPQLENKKEIKN